MLPKSDGSGWPSLRERSRPPQLAASFFSKSIFNSTGSSISAASYICERSLRMFETNANAAERATRLRSVFSSRARSIAGQGQAQLGHRHRRLRHLHSCSYPQDFQAEFVGRPQRASRDGSCRAQSNSPAPPIAQIPGARGRSAFQRRPDR